MIFKPTNPQYFEYLARVDAKQKELRAWGLDELNAYCQARSIVDREIEMESGMLNSVEQTIPASATESRPETSVEGK